MPFVFSVKKQKDQLHCNKKTKKINGHKPFKDFTCYSTNMCWQHDFQKGTVKASIKLPCFFSLEVALNKYVMTIANV